VAAHVPDLALLDHLRCRHPWRARVFRRRPLELHVAETSDQVDRRRPVLPQQVERGQLVRLGVAPRVLGIALVEQLGVSGRHWPTMGEGLHPLGDPRVRQSHMMRDDTDGPELAVVNGALPPLL
jgi:hypothetical protein